MKYSKKYSLPILMVLSIVVFADACNKSKLNAPPLGNIDENLIANKQGVQGLLIGAYSVLNGTSTGADAFVPGKAPSNWIFGSVCGSEAYEGSERGDDWNTLIRPVERFEVVSTNDLVYQKWSALYDGIARANSVIRTMRKAKDLTSGDTTEIRAEAVFLRALYHFEAKKMWNNIQLVDENISYDQDNFHLKNDPGWSLIITDLEYAIAKLPETQEAIGRANKYAAKAMLAKVYMFRQMFTEAGPLLEDLIQHGKTSAGVSYRLTENYSDNFHPSTKNGPECIFAAQMSVNDGANGPNGNIGDHSNYPSGIPEAGGWNFFQPSQYFVNHFKTNSAGLPDLDHFNDTDITSDEGVESADSSFIPYPGTIDPRLDLTIGRRGIPYLDYGVNPGKEWVRLQEYGGPYLIKKNIIFRNEIASYSNSNVWMNATITANNVNLIRFADVLLWAAEVAAESNNFDAARNYVNQIRSRAANPAGWVYTYIDSSDPSKGITGTQAANYKVGLYTIPWTSKTEALKAIRYERMLELGLEGHRFFDLVRWGIADTEINAYLQKEMKLRQYLQGSIFKKDKNEYFPIPIKEIDNSYGKLIQNPGY